MLFKLLDWAMGLTPIGTMVGLVCAWLTNGLLLIIILIIFLFNRPSANCYIVFSYLCIFKRFFFAVADCWTWTNDTPFRGCSTDWAKSTNLCHTIKTVVRTVYIIGCTLWHTQYGFILTTQYLFVKLALATFQPRGSPLGLDHSPKPLTVDFVKLCGLRIVFALNFLI